MRTYYSGSVIKWLMLKFFVIKLLISYQFTSTHVLNCNKIQEDTSTIIILIDMSTFTEAPPPRMQGPSYFFFQQITIKKICYCVQESTENRLIIYSKHLSCGKCVSFTCIWGTSMEKKIGDLLLRQSPTLLWFV